MTRSITPSSSLDNLKKEAKRWLRAVRAGNDDARARLAKAHPSAPQHPWLRDVQHALAREYGHESWTALTKAVYAAALGPASSGDALRSITAYEQIAADWVAVQATRDEAALARLNAHYSRSFTLEDAAAEIWRRVHAFRQRSSTVVDNRIQSDEARLLVAQDVGFGSWEALANATVTGQAPLPPYRIDVERGRIGPTRQLVDKEWDAIFEAMRERRITRLETHGLMTDAVLSRLADLDHITSLDLGGSRQITDDGLRHLERMPQLEHLGLSGSSDARVTDRGMEVLRHLPRLTSFEMCWHKGVTDAGIANLRFCDALERVNLMGSSTGDGVIEALQGKAALRDLSTGRFVTDEGLRRLGGLPRFKTRHDDVGGADARRGAHLLLDGPFSNRGVSGLIGLEGLVGLDLFWHVTHLTSVGLAHLVDVPNLESLGADGKLSDDDAMACYGAMPKLRNLRAQEAPATDAGFEALSRSRTLEQLWGRRCQGFGSRGFRALSTMPALRSLGIGCERVDDDALSRLPSFPALRELTPIDVSDDGFRFVGQCAALEKLSCMYCRTTTDVSTGHVAGLSLRWYYAGLTKITDRSLEILGGMHSLEEIELFECTGITDAGLQHLAGLPRLRVVTVGAMPGVTHAGMTVFPSRVNARYST